MRPWPPLMRERTRAALHVLGAAWANARGRITLPRAMHYCPTWRCNQGCVGCDAREGKAAGEMTTDQAIGLFSRLRFLDLIKIVGGEPFMRPDLADIGEFALATVRPYVLQIVTNGSLTREIVALAERLGGPRLQFRVSLSGVGATHERLTGGSFAATDETLNRLIELRARRGFGLGVNYRLSDETLADLPLLQERYGARGVDIVPGLHVRPFMTNVDVRRTTFTLEGGPPSERVRQALADLQRRRGGPTRLEALLLGRAGRRAAAGALTPRPFGCRELRNLIYVFPNGDLVYCGLRHVRAANLIEEDFDTAWGSVAMDGHRREIDQCPGCPQAAIEILSRLYRGRVLG